MQCASISKKVMSFGHVQTMSVCVTRRSISCRQSASTSSAATCGPSRYVDIYLPILWSPLLCRGSSLSPVVWESMAQILVLNLFLHFFKVKGNFFITHKDTKLLYSLISDRPFWSNTISISLGTIHPQWS